MSSVTDDMRINIELMKEIKRHQCLYNYNNKGYGNKTAADKAWNEIGKRFRGITVDELKTKWRSARSSFSRSFRTQKEYYLNKYLDFLVPYSKSQHIKDNSETPVVKRVKKEEEDSDSDSSESSDDCIIEIEETKCEEDSDNDEENKEFNGTIQVSALPELKFEGSSKSDKPKVTRTKILSQYTKSRLSPQECYLKSLMPDVNAMSQRQFFNFRRGILNVIGKIKYRTAPETGS